MWWTGASVNTPPHLTPPNLSHLDFPRSTIWISHRCGNKTEIIQFQPNDGSAQIITLHCSTKTLISHLQLKMNTVRTHILHTEDSQSQHCRDLNTPLCWRVRNGYASCHFSDYNLLALVMEFNNADQIGADPTGVLLALGRARLSLSLADVCVCEWERETLRQLVICQWGLAVL